MLSRKFLKYLSSFQARMKTIFEMLEVPVKQVARASSSAVVCDRAAGGEAPALCAGSGQRAARNGQWAAGNGQRAAGNGQRAAGNGQWAAGNGQQGTGNRQEGTGNRQQGTGNMQQGTGIREWAVGSKEWAAGNGQWAARLSPCLPQPGMHLLCSITSAIVYWGGRLMGGEAEGQARREHLARPCGHRQQQAQGRRRLGPGTATASQHRPGTELGRGAGHAAVSAEGSGDRQQGSAPQLWPWRCI